MINGSLYGALYDAVMKPVAEKKMDIKDIEQHAKSFYELYKTIYPGEKVNIESLIRDIVSNYSVWVGDSMILEDNMGHVEWLYDRKSLIKWSFWRRYEAYLRTIEKLPPNVVTNIDTVSDDILGRLEDPNREGQWDRRGMVVGSVQSGKTSNYTGLICKAVDAGYKIIIVLAGMNNDLRSQTQKRIDKGFLGENTSKKENYDQTTRRIGAGTLPGYSVPHVIALTNSDASGDFRKTVHSAVTVQPGSDPIVFVVKKNVSPLKNLLNWTESINESGVIADVPILLIDDEADHASIDTNAAKRIGVNDDDYAEKDPTKINGLIRKILSSFTQSAYVGYTATPFANIFIHPDVSEKRKTEYGEDLFPRSFIINLNPPSNYIGPEKVFGLYEDKLADTEEKEGLPLTRPVSDYEEFLPEKHKSYHLVHGIPESMKKAIRAFILSCTARYVRGQKAKHNSMLIHVTRFVDVQSQLVEYIKNEIYVIVGLLEMRTGPGYKTLVSEFKEMWEGDFEKTTLSVMSSIKDTEIIRLKWCDIEKYLYDASSKIIVKAVNGKAADGGLDYDSYKNGLSVIAVGGDKLSRGLTLEGLTVSYYTRATKMYDSLMQMGRWFGYRPGYADLCRLYTSSSLINWYQHLAVVNYELRNELDFMALMNSTPENYGLKVRTHPEGMLITAMNKMRNSVEKEVTFSGRLVETTRFYRNSDINAQNYDFTDKWLKSLGDSKGPNTQTKNNYVWDHVDVDKIYEFLSNFTVHNTCFNSDPQMISQYISGQAKDGELVNWTVALVSTLTGNVDSFGGCDIGVPWRTDQSSVNDNENTIFLSRNHLITEADQYIDLTTQELEKALRDTIENPSKRTKGVPSTPSPIWVRRNRKPQNGLLLIYCFNSGPNQDTPYNQKYIGFAFSFPESNTAKPVKYKVDEVYRRNHYDEDFE